MKSFNSTLIFSRSKYSLRKCRNIFFQLLKQFKRKQKHMTPSTKNVMSKAFEAAQDAIFAKDLPLSQLRIEALEALSKMHLRKNAFDKFRDLFGALLFALVIAVIVRQMWFEYYEIPTGSMRPTLKEKDRLVVSKNQFGINVPLMQKHFYFNPDLVQRGGIVVFSGGEMDIPDVNTMYFFLFPGKKQYIKRMIGKPGDTLYFASGKIYGIDKNGNDISSEIQRETLGKINHIPFIHFEGRAILPKAPTQGIYSPVTIYQMNEPVAKLQVSTNRTIQGEILSSDNSSSKITRYEDLWGFKNYAMARIIDKKHYLTLNGSNLEKIAPADLYLELTHSPSIQNATLERDYYGRIKPALGLSKSYIPLNETHLKRLFDNLYTARFIVDDHGNMRRYGYKKSQQPQIFQAKIENVEPGTYEFYHGDAYKIGWQGSLTKLPKTHPIYSFSAEKTQTFFNLGIEFDTRFSPDSLNHSLLPSRYAFFRDGNLYAMDTLTYTKDDPFIKDFKKNEVLRASYSNGTYVPFAEQKVPMKDGKIDKDFMKKYGVTVPDHSYLVLGDNYAMSADSRDFGFVPEENLKGVPDFLFWPFGERFGYPNQPFYSFITLPRVIVWILGFATIIVSIVLHRKRTRLQHKFD